RRTIQIQRQRPPRSHRQAADRIATPHHLLQFRRPNPPPHFSPSHFRPHNPPRPPALFDFLRPDFRFYTAPKFARRALRQTRPRRSAHPLYRRPTQHPPLLAIRTGSSQQFHADPARPPPPHRRPRRSLPEKSPAPFRDSPARRPHSPPPHAGPDRTKQGESPPHHHLEIAFALDYRS